ncbi:hypothetical protein ADK55_17580 [Streptomyces sp. WM4235]|nr:hypothetical protein ADK55_17580 [Streptomyces sp. WM4235]
MFVGVAQSGITGLESYDGLAIQGCRLAQIGDARIEAFVQGRWRGWPRLFDSECPDPLLKVMQGPHSRFGLVPRGCSVLFFRTRDSDAQ